MSEAWRKEPPDAPGYWWAWSAETGEVELASFEVGDGSHPPVVLFCGDGRPWNVEDLARWLWLPGLPRPRGPLAD